MILATASSSESASASSPSAVVISPGEGQILLITDSVLSFLTPSQGIQVDSDAVQKDVNNSSNGKGKGREDTAMALFKTSLVIKRKELYKWSEHTPEVRTATTPVADTNWRAAVWSPPNLSVLGGSLLATLTTNCDVAIYEAPKNSHRGEWIKTFDITAALVKRYLPDTELEKSEIVSRVIQCQATTIAWSPAVERNDLGSSWSILAVGHRSGHITFWAAVTEENGETSMRFLHRLRIDERAAYITTMCWSTWKLPLSDSQTAIASLAVADSSGKLWYAKITQDCSVPRPAADAEDDEEDEEPSSNGLFVHPIVEVGGKDLRHVSQMCWFIHAAEKDEESLVLAYTRLGSVHFAYFVDAPAGDMDDGGIVVAKEFELDLDKVKVNDWVGATSLGICCGLEYFPDSHSILLTLSSGSFHAISLDPEPAFIVAESELDSVPLTANARRHFVQSILESRKKPSSKFKTGVLAAPPVVVNETQGMKILGMAGVAGAIGWFFAVSTPTLLTYRPKAKGTFLIAELFGEVEADTQIARFQAILKSPPNSLYICPSKTLSSFLLFVGNNIENVDFRNRIVKILSVSVPKYTPQNGTITSIRNLEELITASRETLFGPSAGTELEDLRIRETVERFILRLDDLPYDITNQILPLQILHSRKIVHQVMARLAKLLSLVDRSACELSPEEASISTQLSLASTKLGHPFFEDLNGVNVSPDQLVSSFAGKEKCPACQAKIPFKDVRTATCANHHVWERCAMTLRVISSSHTRTCVNCERKVTVTPASDGEGVPGVVYAMVRATPCCLYCGGRWMMIR